jgi:hypothetical protein
MLIRGRNGYFEGVNGSCAAIKTNVSIGRFRGAHKKRSSCITAQRTGDGFTTGLDAVGYLATLTYSQY